VIKVHLERIQFDGAGRPTRCTPADGVVIDPEVQAEAPCVEGTRIPTRVVAERAAVEPDDDIARYRSWALGKKCHRTVRTHVRR